MSSCYITDCRLWLCPSKAEREDWFHDSSRASLVSVRDHLGVYGRSQVYRGVSSSAVYSTISYPFERLALRFDNRMNGTPLFWTRRSYSVSEPKSAVWVWCLCASEEPSCGLKEVYLGTGLKTNDVKSNNDVWTHPPLCWCIRRRRTSLLFPWEEPHVMSSSELW